MIDTDVKTLAIPGKIAPQFSLYEMVPKFVSQSCLFNFYPSYLLENLKLWVWGHIVPQVSGLLIYRPRNVDQGS